MKRVSRVPRGVALGCVFGISVVALWSVLSPAEPAQIEPQASAPSAPRLAPPSAQAVGSSEPSSPVSSSSLHTETGTDESGELQPEDIEWRNMSPAARTRRLEENFSDAIAGLEAGERSQALVTQAEGALSGLRAQMYAAPQGRQRHEALEAQLVALADQQPSASERHTPK